MKWNYQRRRRDKVRGYIIPEEWTAPGLIARGCETSNAHKLSIGRSFNGSGGKAFGGANSWPTVELQVSFQEGDERLARNFARRLRILTMEFCNELDAPARRKASR